MNASTKGLLLIVAVAAFGVGWVVNSASVESEVETDVLLAAELIETEQPQTTSRVKDKLEQVTLVNFWASWCAPCREEMPMFESMYQQYQQAGFQVVGIAIDSPAKTQAMLDSAARRLQLEDSMSNTQIRHQSQQRNSKQQQQQCSRHSS